MRNRIWVALTCLIALTMLLMSCGPKDTTTTTTTSVTGTTSQSTSVTTTTASTTTIRTDEEKDVTEATTPKYGGTLTGVYAVDFRGFDAKTVSDWLTPTPVTHEKLQKGDWARGPAGTNEVQFILPGMWAFEYDTPFLATSWETPDKETIVLHIRQGVPFQNKAPAYGREMTAEDVAYSILRRFNDPISLNYTKVAANRIISATATDKWTVTVKVPAAQLGVFIQGIVAETWIYPKELGTGLQSDWRDVCGTGAFIVSDYVAQSSATFSKNPNYWFEDPVNPGNKLPYVDLYRVLIIPDASTIISAIRTGKIDQSRGLAWDTAESLKKSNPELNYMRYLPYVSPYIDMRMDNPSLPYDDIRVRRALNMAVDREAIIQDYYKGNAEAFCQPIGPFSELADIFVPLSEQPVENQELYTYLPEKAKALLTEAGYPNGFTAKIVCNEAWVDVLSIIKEQWVKIGVTLEFDIKETAALTSIQQTGGYTELLAAGLTSIYYAEPLRFLKKYTPVYNRGYGYDQYIEDYYKEKLLPYAGNPATDKTLRQNLRALVPYLVGIAWVVEVPNPYVYCMWQPWLGGYGGEYSIGHWYWDNWPMYVWVDQDVKAYYAGKR